MEEDKTALLALNAGWHKLAMEHLVDTFGRFGMDAVGCVAEAVMYANAFGEKFDAQELYYRGEHRYGHELRSQAERNMVDKHAGEAGITTREIEELRRFQDQVAADPDKYSAISSDPILNDENHPRWLPVMQHYDDDFGTRLLDISTSIHAGLYFACISWDGEINTDIDGVLYVLIGGNPGMTVRGYYHEVIPEVFDPEYDDVAPESVEDSFKDWEAPTVFRIYKSGTMSERELAQDGLFLVKGSFDEGPGFGQSFKFRVPAEAKQRIARELWRAGYTPRRIVRGPKGESGHVKLAKELGMPEG